MLWALEPLRRSWLRKLNAWDQEYLCHGYAYFGELRAFSIECPDCSEVYHVDTASRNRVFSRRTQRFHCRRCGMKLQLLILAETLLPPESVRSTSTDRPARIGESRSTDDADSMRVRDVCARAKQPERGEYAGVRRDTIDGPKATNPQVGKPNG